jgi:hypothetical protein
LPILAFCIMDIGIHENRPAQRKKSVEYRPPE